MDGAGRFSGALTCLSPAIPLLGAVTTPDSGSVDRREKEGVKCRQNHLKWELGLVGITANIIPISFTKFEEDRR